MTQFKKTLLRLLIILIFPVFGFAQSTYLPQQSKYDHFLERMEVLMQNNPDLNVLTPKPLSRKMAVQIAELADSLNKFYPYDDYYHLSKVDQYNLHDLLMNNMEWVKGSQESFKSKHPLWKTFYNDKANFAAVNVKDFFLAINPVFQFDIAKESGNNENVFLNSKGLELRGMIADRLGFSTYLTDNQERGPSFF